MRRALLILTQNEPAIFTERPATEGVHKSLRHLPGAALLGWAARQAGYGNFDDAHQVFHSGLVRFSNGMPLTPAGYPAYPVPQILMKPKHTAAKIENVFNESVRVGRPGPDAEPHEALKGLFVTRGGALFSPAMGGRLRTATVDGRAKPAGLFGFEHIEAADADRKSGAHRKAAAAEQRFAATIEAKDLGQHDWDRLIGAFNGTTLRLGRAAGTFYGGMFECYIEESAKAAGLWPKGEIVKGVKEVRVWVLSDLALLDRFGNFCLRPTPEMLDLPKGGLFDGARSAVAARRYAPWNRHLGTRDIERQVIEAGSVLTFAYEDGAAAHTPSGLAGLWREAGLGRIWVQPPMLEDEYPERKKNGDGPRIADRLGDTSPASEPSQGYAGQIVAWAKRPFKTEDAA